MRVAYFATRDEVGLWVVVLWLVEEEHCWFEIFERN